LDADTDDGGVPDGAEVDAGTDPLDPSDDVEVPDDTGPGADDTGADDPGKFTGGGGCSCTTAEGEGPGAGSWLALLGLLGLLRRRRQAG
ncbi:MAG: MYXO-CTERM sorting domain-containing protein, partial [Alphaproteobacteria bacterium]|nr:MYXO-CTERM sorting domain-containing protein [Alphaproteobacteria bacterium]